MVVPYSIYVLSDALYVMNSGALPHASDGTCTCSRRNLQALPVTIAFARITYSHPTFAKVQPQLSRLLIAANATHSVVAAMLSRLPFAVAQVQDLGLIFLNAMTSDIATRLHGQPHEVIVGTAVVACSLATMLLGLVLIVVGKCVLHPRLLVSAGLTTLMHLQLHVQSIESTR